MRPTKKQATHEAQNAELLAEIEAFNADSVKTDSFINIVRHYTQFDELTPQMLNEFVERIHVHEADKSSGERIQEVEIIFNFIGKFDFPIEEVTPTEEELAAEEKRRAKLAKQREYNRRWYAKKRAEIKAAICSNKLSTSV